MLENYLIFKGDFIVFKLYNIDFLSFIKNRINFYYYN